MTEPLEARLLRLAKAATPGAVLQRYGQTVYMFRASGMFVTEAQAATLHALIVALSPSAVILLARVVEAARPVREWMEHMAECDVCHFVVRPPVPKNLRGFPTKYCEVGKSLDFNLFRDVLPLVDALRSLDASQEENRP